MNCLKLALPEAIRNRNDIKHEVARFAHKEQLGFIMGRENGEFLARLMTYNNAMYPREDWAEISPMIKNMRLTTECGVKALAKIYNKEYHNNCCRVCGYYIFNSGCEYCGVSRREHEFNIYREGMKSLYI
jgi:hypothetical protein